MRSNIMKSVHDELQLAKLRKTTKTHLLSWRHPDAWVQLHGRSVSIFIFASYLLKNCFCLMPILWVSGGKWPRFACFKARNGILTAQSKLAQHRLVFSCFRGANFRNCSPPTENLCVYFHRRFRIISFYDFAVFHSFVSLSVSNS